MLTQRKQCQSFKKYRKLVKKWRVAVFMRDKKRCVLCGHKTSIQAHHIERWVDAPHLRFELSNGVTLCYECHHYYHDYRGARFPKHVTQQLKALANGRPHKQSLQQTMEDEIEDRLVRMLLR